MGGRLAAAAVVLFWCFLRESQTAPVNADGSGMVLQGWDMLHGNLLLSGWWLADVTFYTFEIPIDAVVAGVHGLNPDVVHISAAIIYTLLVLTGAMLARGTARGTEGIVRALVGAGTVGIGATLVAGTFATQTAPVSGAHEIVVVLPFGAVLAGRTTGPWLAGRRLPRITLGPLLAVALAGYLAALGYNASLPSKPAEMQGLADFLVAHHLTSGLGRYWAANSTTLASGGRVRVAAVQDYGRVPYSWVTKPEWYRASGSYANFIVASASRSGNAYAFPQAAVRHLFGKPAREYRYDGYVIMVWNRNILVQEAVPDQSKALTPRPRAVRRPARRS